MTWLLLTGLLIYTVAALLDLAVGRRAPSSPYWIAALIPVDVLVPGSRLRPFSLLHAILLALGRVLARAPSRPHADTPDVGGSR